MMNTEPACQENCLCDETCQPRGYIKGRGRLSIWDSEHWAMESPAKGLFTRTIILNNTSRLNLATKIQALTATGRKLYLHDAILVLVFPPPSKHDCGREVSLTRNSSFLVVVILTMIFFPLFS